MLKLLKYKKIWYLSVGLLLILSCEALEEPDLVNPLDPENPEYIPPKTTILSGPGEGEVLALPDVSITWRGNIAGSKYSFRLDSSDWSDWGVDSTVLLRLLDEDDHLFEVRTRYPSGDIEDPPTSLAFTVDAVRGPAFIFYPRLTSKNTGESFTLELMAEEVHEFAISEVYISWDISILELQSITVYEDSAAFLKSNGGTVISFVNSSASAGNARINIGVVGGSPSYVEGTGSLVRITFRGIQSGNSVVEILQISSMRNENNKEITVNEVISSVVEIE